MDLSRWESAPRSPKASGPGLQAPDVWFRPWPRILYFINRVTLLTRGGILLTGEDKFLGWPRTPYFIDMETSFTGGGGYLALVMSSWEGLGGSWGDLGGCWVLLGWGGVDGRADLACD